LHRVLPDEKFLRGRRRRKISLNLCFFIWRSLCKINTLAVFMGERFHGVESGGVTCSARELARLFGVQPRAIQALAAKGAVVRATHGRYLRDASILAYVMHLRESAAGRLTREGGEDALNASADLKREQAALARARRRILENEVIDIARIQPTWTRMARVVRASVMAVPSRCRAALPHLSAFDQNKIDEIVRDSLTCLASATSGANLIAAAVAENA
jgi:terminase small subunit / prophage DNA-packing protein